MHPQICAAETASAALFLLFREVFFGCSFKNVLLGAIITLHQ